jgi:Collagen triple helix repeat (20 copies)
MLGWIRRRATYANVAMTIALVFAMSGGAYAAGKYLITSTKQINPKVLRALKGANGKNGTNGVNGTDGAPGEKGPTGATGTQGPQGPEGKEGPTGKNGTNGKEGKEGKEGSPWTAGGTLPSGKSEKGTWGVATMPGSFLKGAAVLAISPISFTIPLAETVKANVIGPGGKGGGGGACPETSELSKPEAEPGNLCIFEGAFAVNVNEVNPIAPENGVKEGGKTGVIVEILPTNNSEPVFVNGTWAVTAK